MEAAVNQFKRYEKSVLTERTVFQIDKNRVIDKRLVNRGNIGSIFRLFGFTKYPSYEEFSKANFIIECNLTNVYKGWLSKPKVNLLKVLHLIAVLNHQFNLLKVPNSKLAKLYIDNKNVSDLVNLYFNSDPLSIYSSRASDALENVLLKEAVMLRDKYDPNTDMDLTVTLRDFNDNSKIIYLHNDLPKGKAKLNDTDYVKLINVKGIGPVEEKEKKTGNVLPTPDYFAAPFPNIDNAKMRNKILLRIDRFHQKTHTTDPNTWGIAPGYLDQYVRNMRDEFKDLEVSVIADADNFILENKKGLYYVFTDDGNVFTATSFNAATEIMNRRLDAKEFSASTTGDMPEDVKDLLNQEDKKK